MVSDADLIRAQREAILDPFDPEVIREAEENGIDPGWIACARKSPVYKFVKEWELALPLHPEYRTMAMMFYIPPLSPVVSVIQDELYHLDLPENAHDFELINRLDSARLPVKYLANLFSAGDEAPVRSILRKLLAVRAYKRRQSVEGEVDEATLSLAAGAGLDPEQIEAIYHLTTLPTLDERFVLPPYQRELAIEALRDPLAHKGETGLGYLQAPLRGE